MCLRARTSITLDGVIQERRSGMFGRAAEDESHVSARRRILWPWQTAERGGDMIMTAIAIVGEHALSHVSYRSNDAIVNYVY